MNPYSGKFREVVDLFDKMQYEGIEPDDFTFVPVLTAYSHLGNEPAMMVLFSGGGGLQWCRFGGGEANPVAFFRLLWIFC